MVHYRGNRHLSVQEATGNRLPVSWERYAKRLMLRLLVDGGGHKLALQSHYCDDDRLMQVLGVPELPSYDRKEMLSRLFQRHRAAERHPLVAPRSGCLARNLAWLKEHLGLAEAEVSILRFAILMEQHPLLSNAANHLGHLNLRGVIQALAQVLDLSNQAVAAALARQGRLASTGLLAAREKGAVLMEHKLALLEGFGDQMLIPHGETPMGLFSGIFGQVQAPSLALEDYPHLHEQLRTIEGHLRTSLVHSRKGVNILLHGLPGVGKTELARILSQRLGVPAFEVSAQEADGSPFDGLRRLRAYQLTQACTNHSGQAVVLFDEAGDVLSVAGEVLEAGKLTRAGFKAYLNQALETNAAPTLWVCNALRACDPAILRRMDVVLELGVPPRPVRERILDNASGGADLPAALRGQILDHPDIAPAWVSRATQVGLSAMASDASLSLAPQLHHLLSGQLTAVGEEPLPRIQSAQGLLPYRMDCLNPDQDLASICEGLKKFPQGRILAYGPPGTGKTRWGAELARLVGRPLMVRRAADLMGPYVGMTEALIAKAFQEAEHAGAVLLIDEVDTFLGDRLAHGHSWETSMTTQFLQELERFQSVFIATTNLLAERMDPASLRRFDLKVRLDYLKPEGAWSLFQEAAHQLGFPAGPELEPAVKALRHLTPGDFAAVLRRSRFAPLKGDEALYQALLAEVRFKPVSTLKTVGF